MLLLFTFRIIGILCESDYITGLSYFPFVWFSFKVYYQHLFQNAGREIICFFIEP